MLTLMLVGGALITLSVVWAQFRSNSLTWDIGAVFVLAVGWSGQLATVVNKVTESTTRYYDAYGKVVVTAPPTGEILLRISQLPILVVAGMMMFTGRGSSRISILGLAVIGTSIAAMLADSTAYINLLTGAAMLLLFALIAATFFAPSREGALTGGAVFTLSVAAFGGIWSAIQPEQVFTECPDKCTFAGEIYTGMTGHGNTLGLITAVGIPTCWLAFKSGWVRVWLISYLFMNILLSGSRTALYAAVLTLVALLLTIPTLNSGGTGRNRPVLTVLVLGLTAVAIILPLTARPDGFATGRGYLWRIALEQFEQTPFIGAGLTVWNRFYAAGEFGAAAAYSTHNQWVEPLLLSGVIGASIFLLGWVATALMGDNSRLFQVLPVMLPIAFLGITERPLSFGLVNTMTWALVALVILASDARTHWSRTQKVHSRSYPSNQKTKY